MSLFKKYKSEIRANYDWRSMRDNPEYTGEDEEGNMRGRNYVGSLINPSGRYYLPFACGNVDSCSQCKGAGKGTSRHICDKCKGEGVRTVYEIITLTGEDPQVCKSRLLASGVVFAGSASLVCASCNGEGTVARKCKRCGGLGSYEAYQDQVFWEALDAIAESFGGWIESGEGDPCDTFFFVPVEEE